MAVSAFEFHDLESGDAGYCSIRATSAGVGIALSLMSDGDVEVFLSADDARKMAEFILGALTTD